MVKSTVEGEGGLSLREDGTFAATIPLLERVTFTPYPVGGVPCKATPATVDWNLRVDGAIRDADGHLVFTHMATETERVGETKSTVSCLGRSTTVSPPSTLPLVLDLSPLAVLLKIERAFRCRRPLGGTAVVSGS